MRSSISDTHKYKNIIEKALNDNDIFKNFKQLSDYNEILEHTTKNQAIEYLKIIKNDNKQLIQGFQKFKDNDVFGNPRKNVFKDIGEVSPSTLRYVKVLSDIINIFGGFNNKNIVEIGGGYGGQCLIFSKYFSFNSYLLIDLKESLDLSKKYLNLNNIKNVIYKDISKLNETVEYDLLISNYAFTECNKKIQDIYIKKIINNSRNGYITANFISDIFNIESYNNNELINIINKNILINEEKPKTHNNNLILTWIEK